MIYAALRQVHVNHAQNLAAGALRETGFGQGCPNPVFVLINDFKIKPSQTWLF
jgi:hypothetical protein